MNLVRCKTCVMPNTRPDTHWVDGECSACISYRNRPTIDWDARLTMLHDLLDRHNGRCIVPVSGGKDSTYQVVKLKELGAYVTAVCATTCMLTEMGRRNLDNIGRLANELIEYTPNQQQRAKLNRLGLEMVGDISHPEHMAIFTVPFRAAAQTGIPLLFYGENPQDQYGGPPGSDQAMQMTRRWVSEFGGFNGLRHTDLEPLAGDMSYYAPPDPKALGKIEAHFLGQYIPWDSNENAAVAKAHGFLCVAPCEANWWPEENQDNAQTGLHDHLMWAKFGFGRGCQQISVDVRRGEVTRDYALGWVHRYDGEFPTRYMNIPFTDVLEHIGMSFNQFQMCVKNFTNTDIHAGS